MSIGKKLSYIFLFLLFSFSIAGFLYTVQKIFNLSLLGLMYKLMIIGSLCLIIIGTIPILNYYESRFINIKEEGSKLFKEEDLHENFNYLFTFSFFVSGFIIVLMFVIHIVDKPFLLNFLVIYLCIILGFLATLPEKYYFFGQKWVNVGLNSLFFFGSYHMLQYYRTYSA